MPNPKSADGNRGGNVPLVLEIRDDVAVIEDENTDREEIF